MRAYFMYVIKGRTSVYLSAKRFPQLSVSYQGLIFNTLGPRTYQSLHYPKLQLHKYVTTCYAVILVPLHLFLFVFTTKHDIQYHGNINRGVCMKRLRYK